jgi:hypothetical protein
MFRMTAVSLALVLPLVATGPTAARAQTPAPAAPAAAPVAPTAATPETAAAFLGDWTLTAEGANGPAEFALSVKTEAGKVAAEISSAMQPRQPVTDLSTAGTSFILKYTFDYQGMAVPVVVTLKPADDNVGVQLDFADGAYQMVGTAARVKPATK